MTDYGKLLSKNDLPVYLLTVHEMLFFPHPHQPWILSVLENVVNLMSKIGPLSFVLFCFVVFSLHFPIRTGARHLFMFTDCCRSGPGKQMLRWRCGCLCILRSALLINTHGGREGSGIRQRESWDAWLRPQLTSWLSLKLGGPLRVVLS